MGTTLLPSEVVANERRTGQQHISFDVRLTKAERKALDKLSKDFAESLVLIFTKSLRLYRATVDAADQGQSLVLIKNSVRDSNRANNTSVFRTSILSKGDKEDILIGSQNIRIEQGDQTASETARLLNTTTAATNFKDLEGDCCVSMVAEPKAKDIINTQANGMFQDVATIAARDQFAPYSITPISLNPEYITIPKGPKTERITLRANQSFIQQLDELESRTGSLKSIIIRDSARLYDFVKRNFSKPDITFHIGGRPIGMI